MRSVVPAELESLDEIADLVARTAAQAGLDTAAAFALRLTVEELVVNIVTHGVQEAEEPVCDTQIVVDGWVDDGAARIRLTDGARAFDPTLVPTPDDLEVDLAHRDIGGLGIHLVRTMVDEFSYRREDGHNVVTVAKRAGSRS